MYPNKEGDKDKWRHRERREANLLDIDRKDSLPSNLKTELLI